MTTGASVTTGALEVSVHFDVVSQDETSTLGDWSFSEFAELRMVYKKINNPKSHTELQSFASGSHESMCGSCGSS